MSDSWRSDNPYAPKISHTLYMLEKFDFAGYITGAVLYGTIIVLFFQCMIALFDPAYRRGNGVKWGLGSYTVVMFSLATISTGMNLNILSVSYIDNREYPTGPFGYAGSVLGSKAINVVPNAAVFLGGWLADGLLLYRCYVIYSANLWVVAFPCLLYIGSVATGTLAIYQGWGLVWIGVISSYSISVVLNLLLTSMIVIRLIRHGRSIHPATGCTGPRVGINGLHKIIATMLVESCALYTAASLLVILPVALDSAIGQLFLPIFFEIQVIAPLLIVKRVANRSALTSKSIVTGNTGSSYTRNRGESTSGSTVVDFRQDEKV